MNTKTVALTTAVLLAMGATVSARANMNIANASDFGIDSVAGGLTNDDMIPRETGIAVKQNIIVAKKAKKPPKCKKHSCL